MNEIEGNFFVKINVMMMENGINGMVDVDDDDDYDDDE